MAKYVYEFRYHLLTSLLTSQQFGRGRYLKNYGMYWKKKFLAKYILKNINQIKLKEGVQYGTLIKIV